MNIQPIKKLGEGILKTILRVLTIIVRGLFTVYTGFSKFAKSKQKGIWILVLVIIILGSGVFILKKEKEYRNLLREIQSNEEKYETLLNDYKELNSQYEKILEVQSNSERNKNVPLLVENWRYLIIKYFPPEQVENAMAIMACESKGNPNAINNSDTKITGYPSCGLFQINGPMNWEWNNPDTNVDRAVTMFYTRGWQPWRNCAIKLGLI